MKTVAVSGGFDPIHVGHVRMFKKAKAYGDKLIVLVNNDNWLMKKKGFVFMPQDERVEIIRSLKYVDGVMLTQHEKNPKDMSVCKELEYLRPDIFANGGDRKEGNIPEYNLCEKLGIKMIFGVGGDKVQSSSELVKKAKNKK